MCSPVATLLLMYDIRKTDTYVRWLDSLSDVRARARVLARVERLAVGNPGDVRPVVEEYLNCESIMVLVIASITQ